MLPLDPAFIATKRTLSGCNFIADYSSNIKMRNKERRQTTKKGLSMKACILKRNAFVKYAILVSGMALRLLEV